MVLTDDNAVWYRAEFAGGSYDGVEINVSGGTIGSNVAVEVYVGGPDAACDGTAEFKSFKMRWTTCSADENRLYTGWRIYFYQSNIN